MSEKSFKRSRNLLVFTALVIMAVPLESQEYTSLGADSCLSCHGEGSPKPATAIFQTLHASRTDPAAPFSNLQCETCHGPGEDHVFAQQRGNNVLPARTFGIKAETPVAEQNKTCLACHETRGGAGLVR